MKGALIRYFWLRQKYPCETVPKGALIPHRCAAGVRPSGLARNAKGEGKITLAFCFWLLVLLLPFDASQVRGEVNGVAANYWRPIWTLSPRISAQVPI